MFKKSIYIISFLMVFTPFVYSQEPILSLQDLIPGGKTFSKYRANLPKNIRWWGDKPIYTKGDSIIQIPLSKKEKEKTLITKGLLNEYLEASNLAPLKSLAYIDFPYADKDIIKFNNNGVTYLFDLKEKKEVAAFSYPANAENFDFSPQTQVLAYTIDNNLYIATKDGKTLTISSEDNKSITYGGNNVHRNEFGISKGTFWSPDGNYLAFYRMDQTMVEDYPLVDISTREAKLKDIKYPMAGMKSHEVTVGIYSLADGSITYLKTGTPKEKYLTNIAWLPDEKGIYIAELNRGQDTCQVNLYNIKSGKKEFELFTETNSKYVEPQNPPLFLKNNPNSFIWQSRKDGHNHLYIYDTNGKELKQLTSGKWEVTSIIGLDRTNVYITSKEESPIEDHIYKVNLKTGERTKLSKEAGVHQASLSSSGRYLLDIYTSQYNPGKIVTTETANNSSGTFYEAKNPYKNISLPEITLGSIKADDGITDLYYRITKPRNFDPSKKYPTIVYVYGGPHSQLVDNSWMGQARGWDIYMAQLGYVVFTLDNRGTSGRGFDFESIIHRQLGITETKDQMTGVEFLKTLPYVDSDKIGVHGWSYGGFMTLNLMLRHPDVFKVGVAGGSVTDWKYYEIMYGERYMDSPKENPEGYKETSMLEKAGNLKGRLMLIHGDEDPVVVMQHSLQYLKSSIKNSAHPDFFIYPGHGHNMTGADRVHLHEHITRYFEDFLK